MTAAHIALKSYTSMSCPGPLTTYRFSIWSSCREVVLTVTDLTLALRFLSVRHGEAQGLWGICCQFVNSHLSSGVREQDIGSQELIIEGGVVKHAARWVKLEERSLSWTPSSYAFQGLDRKNVTADGVAEQTLIHIFTCIPLLFSLLSDTICIETELAFALRTSHTEFVVAFVWKCFHVLKILKFLNFLKNLNATIRLPENRSF